MKIVINGKKYTRMPRSRNSQGKGAFVQGQGKVREFQFWSGKSGILEKVTEKSGNSFGYSSCLVR